ncbi:LppX_LprAFG lipoprotein [Nocardiopsis akebiae]|uniref:LppX_LprAFG lipoprotein n=2 Tax=Nocardiopsis akebiae TaxID=2831968 RepID=A0ABX8CHB0_9ACTN|nr:LppX_LprAFG lipoprotein [Nocardiopsis akebiae]
MPVLISAGTLALSLTACGGGAAEEEPVEAAAESPEEGGGGSVLDLVAGLGESTQSVDNYTLTMDILTTESPLGEGEVEMSIVYEVSDDPSALQVTAVMPFLGESTLALMEMTGADVSGLTAEEAGTSVMLYPEGQDPLISNSLGQYGDTPWVTAGGEGLGDVSADVFDVEALPQVASAIASLENVSEAGTEEINGVETTVIEGTMTSEEYEALSEEQSAALLQVLGSDFSGTLDIGVWIDDTGFPLRMEFADEVSDVSMEFSALNETNVEIPAEDEIGTM